MDVVPNIEARGWHRSSALWERHGRELIRFATMLVGPDDAADVVSTVFDRVMRLTEAEVDNARAYLFRAVTNAAMDQRRRDLRRQRRELHGLMPAIAAAHETQVDIRRAIARLSVQQRSVVYFAYWEDRSAVEIAEILGVTADTVRRHLARARAHLRKVLR